MHKVLVIDNHDETRNTLAGVLTLEGFKTTQANTGQSGVALAIAERPDLVLLGMHLRDISSAGVVSALKAHGVDVPSIAVTAFPDTNATRELLNAGAAACVEGLHSFEVLLSVVLGLLTESQRRCAPGPDDRSLYTPPDLRTAGSVRPMVADLRIRHVVRLIETEDAEAWTVAALAEQVRLSESRLRHLFAAIIGVPLARFIRERRLQRTARLLLTTADSFSSIAGRVHLPRDVQAARSAFRERFGMSPRTYRARFWIPAPLARSERGLPDSSAATSGEPS